MKRKTKFIDLSADEMAKVDALADALNSTRSGVGRALIQQFLTQGSSYTPPPRNRLQIFIDPETLALAERKALDENNATLADVLRAAIRADGNGLASTI